MQPNIFRKKALEKMSSPEELDRLIQVTNPTGWLALMAMGALLLAALIWGIFGSAPTKVSGKGILLKGGGIYDVVSLGNGQLLDVMVNTGDIIKEGQTIARVAQEQLAEQIKSAEKEIAALEAEYRRTSSFYAQDNPLQAEYLIKERQNFENKILAAEKRQNWQQEKVANQEQLYNSGLITRQTLIQAREDINKTEQEIESIRNDLRQTASKELSLKNQTDRELADTQKKIDAAGRRLEELESQMGLTSLVTSPYAGRVLEIKVDKGTVINNGTAILSLEAIGDESSAIEAVLYVSPFDGKKIRPGMEVNVAPSTVKQEEYGFIRGVVKSVAEFPSTPQGMMRVLPNEQLVTTLSTGGAPIELYAELFTDSSTVSGYKWSSGGGPPHRIFSGTLCNAAVTIRKQAPLTLLIPMLKNATGL